MLCQKQQDASLTVRAARALVVSSEAYVTAGRALTQSERAAVEARFASLRFEQASEWRDLAADCREQTRQSIADLEEARDSCAQAERSAAKYRRAARQTNKRVADLAATSRALQLENRRLLDELQTTRALANLAKTTLQTPRSKDSPFRLSSARNQREDDDSDTDDNTARVSKKLDVDGGLLHRHVRLLREEE